MSSTRSTNLSRRRAILRRGMRLLQRVFSRAEVIGLENIPDEGPLLILFNHLSILDGPVVVGNVPHEIELVGPGDFPMTAIERLIIDAYGITLINRGRADRASLRAMLEHLKAGRMLAMAPDGGTWEKRIHEVKPGAAYLSQVTGTPMLPVGLGGLFHVPVPDAGVLLRRPKITIRFGEIIPPVPPSEDRRHRDADLKAASEAIMQRIIDLLPAEDQARYAFWSRAVYDLGFVFVGLADDAPIAYNGPALPEMAALGEFFAKPNLFRPMHVNARLLVEPFYQRRFFAPIEVKMAARDLYDALTHWPYEVYLQYRLGDDKAQQALAALAALDDVCEWAMACNARMKIVPIVKDSQNPG